MNYLKERLNSKGIKLLKLNNLYSKIRESESFKNNLKIQLEDMKKEFVLIEKSFIEKCKKKYRESQQKKTHQMQNMNKREKL
jgi:hypothetical protein